MKWKSLRLSYNPLVRNKESKRFELTRPNGVRPPNLGNGEATVVYMCLESDGARPKTFDELIEEAKRRKLFALFKTPTATTIPASLNYWLTRFHKDGWIRVTDI